MFWFKNWNHEKPATKQRAVMAHNALVPHRGNEFLPQVSEGMLECIRLLFCFVVYSWWVEVERGYCVSVCVCCTGLLGPYRHKIQKLHQPDKYQWRRAWQGERLACHEENSWLHGQITKQRAVRHRHTVLMVLNPSCRGARPSYWQRCWPWV